MTGATHVGFAALLDALEGALRALVVMLACRRADQLAEFVIESLGVEVAFLLGHPLLETKVWFDDELAVGFGLDGLVGFDTSGQFKPTPTDTHGVSFHKSPADYRSKEHLVTGAECLS